MPEWFKTLGLIYLTVIMSGFMTFVIITFFLFCYYSIQNWKEEREFKKTTGKRKREG